jgi:hypothetical protein
MPVSDAFAHATAPWVDVGLAEALTRLDRTLQRADAGSQLAFEASGTTPESALLQALASTSVSFAAGADGPDGELLDTLLARAQTAVRVETRREDRIMAATTITLGGDTRSIVAAAARADDFRRHRLAVAIELRGRTARLRIFAAVVHAATRIAIASGTGNHLLALHTAWRFVSEVMAERARGETA